MKDGRPILVTGSHRSGTTWAGRTIALSPAVWYVHEPYNVNHAGRIMAEKLKHWFTYVTWRNESDFYGLLKNVMALRYDLLGNLRKVESVQDAKSVILEALAIRAARLRGLRVLMKDPIAVFSADWLAQRFNMEVLVTIRHPAGFASSLKRLGWKPDVRAVLDQPLLMEDHLHVFESEIADFADKHTDIIDQAALLWKIIHHMIIKYQTAHSEWIFVRHEDLAADPVSGYRSIFDNLGLDFTPSIEKRIQEDSDPQNPIYGSDPHLTRRNSMALVKSWQSELSSSEIMRIRNRVEDVACHFYSDDDW